MKHGLVYSKRTNRGFTLVELAVVIAVIGILATISFVTYNGIQERARDTQRVADMKNISEALAVYRGSNKSLPNEQSSGWETTLSYSSNFIDALKTSGLVKSVPIDPINDSRRYYRYYLYPAGYYGCDSARGPYYVLQVVNLDKASSDKPKDNPGFSCPNRNWTNEAWFTIGGYTSG